MTGRGASRSLRGNVPAFWYLRCVQPGRGDSDEAGLPVTYLHIGAMKTGTTYLQALLFANKAELASAGVLVPGKASHEQAQAARDLLDMRGGNARVQARTVGAWQRIAEEVHRHPAKKTVISMEFFGFSDAARAERVVDALSGSELHVIITVRDAAKTIPAQWQTHCRNGGTVPWPTFARQVRRAGRPGRLGQRPKGARVFTRAQDVVRMLEVWGRVVPADRLHVVVVPATKVEPQLLWRRFAAVVGVDPEICSVPVVARNSSLGYASAELLRRVNLHLGKATTAECATELRQLALILAARSSLEQPARIDSRTHHFASRWNRHTRRAVRSSGVDVVGDLRELPVLGPHEPPAATPTITDPDPQAVLAAARAASEELERLIGSSGATSAAQNHRARAPADTDPLTSAVAILAAQIRTLHDPGPRAAPDADASVLEPKEEATCLD